QALIALAAEASEAGGILVERARGDFPTLLMNCALSISQGGYNTLMECMHAGCRSIVVPYAGGLETEQTLRAELLAERGVVTIIPEVELRPATLAAAIDQALAATPAASVGVGVGVRTDGAADSARQIAAWAGALDW
ncbi:MAG: glycosyltransferase, partial [Alphaproteobacteria bacterium]|nr:glycosyltransferase [Alphaproteobacteria bacterium]